MKRPFLLAAAAFLAAGVVQGQELTDRKAAQMVDDYREFIAASADAYEFVNEAARICAGQPQSDDCVTVVAVPLSIAAQARILDNISRERGMFKIARSIAPDFDAIHAEARLGAETAAKAAVQAAERMDILVRVEDKATEMLDNAPILNKFKKDWCGNLGIAVCRPRRW